MKATCWHGQKSVRVDEVPDPKILNARDATGVVNDLTDDLVDRTVGHRAAEVHVRAVNSYIHREEARHGVVVKPRLHAGRQ